MIERSQTSYNDMFPLFIDLSQKKILVIGGGKIAARRIRVLLDFGCSIAVISPNLSEMTMEYTNSVCWQEREYRRGDCRGAYLVLAATDNRDVNHAVAEECRQLRVPVSVADCREECTFFFPAIVQNRSLTVGIVSKTCNHSLVKRSAKLIRDQIILAAAEDED